MDSIVRGGRITWLGHAAFRVDTPGGKVVLIDPWFSNPRSPRRCRGAHARGRDPARAHGILGDTVALASTSALVPCIDGRATISCPKRQETNP
jgi:hypothetical protein